MISKIKKLIEKFNIIKSQKEKINKYEIALDLIENYLIEANTKSKKYKNNTPKDFQSLCVIYEVCNTNIKNILEIIK